MKLKKLITGIMAAALVLTPVNIVKGADGITLDKEHFPDEIFRTYVSQNFDTDGNGMLSDEEIAGAEKISITSKKIADLTGLVHDGKLDEENMILYVDPADTLDYSSDINIKVGGEATIQIGKRVEYVVPLDPSIVSIKGKGKKVILKGECVGNTLVMAMERDGEVVKCWEVQVE